MKKFKNIKYWHSIIIVFTISLFSILFISFDDRDDFELTKQLDIYHTLIRELRMIYVDEIDISTLIQKSIDEMLKSLDPYTVYYPESEIEDFRFITTGNYGGIGALIRTSKKGIIIEEVYENYSAHKAGIIVGDIITKVGEKDVTKKQNEDISILLKGVPNSVTDITIFRPVENKTITFKLKREQINVKNVPYYKMLQNDIAYIKLTGFTQTAYDEVKAALIELKKQGAKKLIFDLRGNPGGLLNESVKIVSLFVKKGTMVVSTKGKVKQWNSNLHTNRNPVDIDIPIVVMVNRNSASAAEIVSGALQDLDRAVVIGQRTYGKGLVQTSRDLSYNTKLKITTAKYYIPSGRCIQALDYTHRNPDGSVGHIPDSLISEFKTKKGRTVFDGGGIFPDVEIERKKMSSIERYLFSNYLIFDFATKFKAENANIENVKDFKLKEITYNKFVEYVEKRNIKYKTVSDVALDNLLKTLKDDNYYNKVSDDVKDLEKKLKRNIKDDLYFFKNRINDYLSAEIISRYYFRNGATEYLLKQNKEKKKAVEILNNITEYNKILTVN